MAPQDLLVPRTDVGHALGSRIGQPITFGGIAGQLEKAGNPLIDLFNALRADQNLLLFTRQFDVGAFALDHRKQAGRVALEDKVAGAIFQQFERKLLRPSLDGQDHRHTRGVFTKQHNRFCSRQLCK